MEVEDLRITAPPHLAQVKYTLTYLVLFVCSFSGILRVAGHIESYSQHFAFDHVPLYPLFVIIYFYAHYFLFSIVSVPRLLDNWPNFLERLSVSSSGSMNRAYLNANQVCMYAFS